MRFEFVETTAIDSNDRSFEFRLPGLPHGLLESVARRGILCPLKARELAGRLQIVSGRRRFAAALQAGLTSVPCMVYAKPELPTLDALWLLLDENRFQAAFSAFEAGRILTLFCANGLEETLIASEVAPLLGMPAGRESVARHVALAAMHPDVLGHPLARDGILLSLVRLDTSAARALWDSWVVPRRPSVQEVRQAVEWIQDLSVRSGRTQADILSAFLSPPGIETFMKALRAARFPCACAVEERFLRACASLPTGIRARMTSTDAVEITLAAQNAQAFARAAAELGASVTALDAVFRASAGE